MSLRRQESDSFYKRSHAVILMSFSLVITVMDLSRFAASSVRLRSDNWRLPCILRSPSKLLDQQKEYPTWITPERNVANRFWLYICQICTVDQIIIYATPFPQFDQSHHHDQVVAWQMLDPSRLLLPQANLHTDGWGLNRLSIRLWWTDLISVSPAITDISMFVQRRFQSFHWLFPIMCDASA